MSGINSRFLQNAKLVAALTERYVSRGTSAKISLLLEYLIEDEGGEKYDEREEGHPEEVEELFFEADDYSRLNMQRGENDYEDDNDYGGTSGGYGGTGRDGGSYYNPELQRYLATTLHEANEEIKDLFEGKNSQQSFVDFFTRVKVVAEKLKAALDGEEVTELVSSLESTGTALQYVDQLNNASKKALQLIARVFADRSAGLFRRIFNEISPNEFVKITKDEEDMEEAFSSPRFQEQNPVAATPGTEVTPEEVEGEAEEEAEGEAEEEEGEGKEQEEDFSLRVLKDLGLDRYVGKNIFSKNYRINDEKRRVLTGDFYEETNRQNFLWNQISSFTNINFHGGPSASPDMNLKGVRNDYNTEYNKFKKSLGDKAGDAPINFPRSIFYPLRDDAAVLFGANIIPSGSGFVIDPDDSLKGKLKAVVGKKIENIKMGRDLIQSFISRISFDESKSDLEVADSIFEIAPYLRALSENIDELFSSIKQRDIWISSNANFRSAYNYSEDLLNSMLLGKELFEDPRFDIDEVCNIFFAILFPNTYDGYWYAKKSEKLNDKTFSEKYGEKINSQILELIKKGIVEYLDLSKTINVPITVYVMGRININNVANGIFQSTAGLDRIKQKWIKCSVCGKNIPSKLTKVGAGEEFGAIVRKHREDISYTPYSMVTKDEGIITLKMLKEHGEFLLSDEQALEISNLYPEGSAKTPVSMSKSWDSIEEDYWSGNKYRHAEAILRKSYALESLGAKKAGRKKNISSVRFKCPYGEWERESPIYSNSKAASKASWSCGFEPSADSISDLSEITSPSLIQLIQSETEDLSALSLLKREDIFGDLDEQSRKDIEAKIKSQQAGGWKFSSKLLFCPTLIAPKNAEEAEAALQKYNFIATPLSGPITAESYTFSYNELGEGDEADEMVYRHDISDVAMPSDGRGGRVELEKGTIAYLVCGKNTSISQFSRDSLKKKISNLLTSKKIAAFNELISSLIKLGVDISDLLPLVSEDDFAEKISNASIDRLSKLFKILKSAQDKTGLTDIEPILNIIGNVELTCSHGHRFTINDSVYFKKTHHDVLSLRPKFYKKKIISSNLLTSTGPDNFSAFKNLNAFINGVTYSASPSLISKEDRDIALNVYGKIEYKDWNYKVDPINKLCFEDPEDPNKVWIYSDMIDSLKKNKILENPFSTLSEKTKVETIQSSASSLYETSADVTLPSGNSLEAAMSQGYGENAFGESDFETKRDVKNELKQAVESQVLVRSSIIASLITNTIISINELLLAATSVDVSPGFIPTSKYTPFSKTIASGEFKSALEVAVKAIINNLPSASSFGEDYNLVVSMTISNAENSLKTKDKINDLFISALKGSYSSFLYRVIILALIKSMEDIFASDITKRDSIYAKSKRLLSSSSTGVNYSMLYQDPEISAAIKTMQNLPSFQEDLKFITSDHQDKLLNKRESHQLKSLVLASTAYYLSEKLSDIYNTYMDKNSPNYIGYSIKDLSSSNADLSTPEGVRAVSIDKLILDQRYYLTEKEASALVKNSLPEDLNELSFTKFMKPIQRCFYDLKNIVSGAAFAARSAHYQEQALEYIRDTLIEQSDGIAAIQIPGLITDMPIDFYDEAVDLLDSTNFDSADERLAAITNLMQSSDLSEEDRDRLKARLDEIKKQKTIAKSIADNIMKKVAYSDLSLSANGKYAKFYADYNNAHMSLPSFSSETISLKVKSKEKGVLGAKYLENQRPIYPLRIEGEYYRNLPISLDHIDVAYNVVILTHETDLDLVSSSLKGEIFEVLKDYNNRDKLLAQYQNNGWLTIAISSSIQALNRLGFNISKKTENISLFNHPATSVYYDEYNEPKGYINNEYSIDTGNGFHIGKYKSGSGFDNYYPPLSRDPFSINTIGIPVPIYIDPNKYKGKVSGKDRVMVDQVNLPIKIFSEKSSYELNISDLLQRAPKDVSFDILNRIQSLWAEYSSKEAKLLNTNKASLLPKLKERYKRSISKLYTRYKNMPFHVEQTPSGSTILAKGKALPASSYYIPFLNPVMMNAIATRECFSPEWGGHNMWPAKVDDLSDILTAMQNFIVKINGYDKLAEEINKGGHYIGEEIDPIELLEPTRVLSDADTRIKPSLFNLSREKAKPIIQNGQYIDFKEGISPSSRGMIALEFLRTLPSWANHNPGFYNLNTTPESEDDVTDPALARMSVRNYSFKRKAERDLKLVQDIGLAEGELSEQILRLDDLTDAWYKIGYDKSGVYLFAEKLQSWFESNMQKISDFTQKMLDIELKGESELTEQDLYENVDLKLKKRTSLNNLDLLKLVRSNIQQLGFIKNSEKYKTPIYLMTTIHDEALRELLDSL